MKRTRTWIDCDINKLDKCLKERNVTRSQASEKMGYSKSFLDHAKYDKRINETASILLNNLYNIKPEDYAFEEAAKEEPIEEKPKETVEYDKLYNTIYQAVYHAMEDVLNK